MSRHFSSFTSSLSTPHQDNYARPAFPKRLHCNQVPRDRSPALVHDTSLRGKRRRRDNLTAVNVDRISDPFSYSRQRENKLKSKQNTGFPSTSSEFGFSSTTSTSQRSMSRTKIAEFKSRRENKNENLPDLVRLRSSAFWELRRSIVENGEGLVRRMRDYERSRSRHQNYLKAKEAEKRGRKLACQRRKVYVSISDESDEDEILIYSGDSNNIQCGSSFGKKSQSHDVMEVDDQPVSWSSASHTKWHNSNLSSKHPSSKELSSIDDGAFTDESSMDLSRHPTSHSNYESLNPSLSLALPPSPGSESASLPSSESSEKGIAALTFALSNGAGSVTDYSDIWKYQEQFYSEEHYDHGEMWH